MCIRDRSPVNVLWSGCKVGGDSHHCTILQFACEEDVGSDVDSYGSVTLAILFDEAADVVFIVAYGGVKSAVVTARRNVYFRYRFVADLSNYTRQM